jgi:hypothetical protein
VLLFFIVVSGSLFFSVFFHKPLDLSSWLTGPPKITSDATSKKADERLTKQQLKTSENVPADYRPNTGGAPVFNTGKLIPDDGWCFDINPANVQFDTHPGPDNNVFKKVADLTAVVSLTSHMLVFSVKTNPGDQRYRSCVNAKASMMQHPCKEGE